MLVFSPSRAAAIASMRPSWPPPMMPMVPPGASGLFNVFIEGASFGTLGYGPRLLGAPGIQFLFHRRIGQAQDRGGMQRGVFGAGLPDGESRHRHPARHLGDRKQGIQTLQGAAF